MRCTGLAFGKYAVRWCAAVVVGTGIVVGMNEPSSARQAPDEVFSSAEAASHALYKAVQQQDEQAIGAILGGDKDLVTAGDEALDKLERERFAQKYLEMHRVVIDPDGHAVLYIGAENWPFPIPLVSQDGGWRFDADTGRNEVLSRRIGENELAAIETCHALVAAEMHGNSETRAGEFSAPVASLLASLRNGETLQPYRGYYFRIIEKPAGGTHSNKAHGTAAFVAYPVAYRSSGVMTFLIGENDVVYEKDLGSDTVELARAITGYAPDATWFVSAE